MNRATMILTAMLAMGESMFVPDPTGTRGLHRKLKPQRKLGEPMLPPLNYVPTTLSERNSMSYEQHERKRKTTRKANQLKFKRYRRAA